MAIKKMKIEVREHIGFKEIERARKKLSGIHHIFGRHHFVYSRLGNVISLIEVNGIGLDAWRWEARCLKGDLFDGSKGFRDKQEADNEIVKLLHPEEQI